MMSTLNTTLYQELSGPLYANDSILILQLILALEPTVGNTTTTVNKEIYVITAIKFIQAIMTITANVVITAIMAISAIMAIAANVFITATIAITTNKEKLIDFAVIAVLMGFTAIMVITVIIAIRALTANFVTNKAIHIMTNTAITGITVFRCDSISRSCMIYRSLTQ